MRTQILIRQVVAWSALVGATIAFGADAPLNLPAPFAPPAKGMSDGRGVLSQLTADLALEMGFPAQAAEIYRQLLAQPGADRSRLTLALATALLAAGEAEEAEKALQAMPEPHGAAWHLRMGLAGLQQKKYELLRATLGPPSQIKDADVSVADHPWYLFLQGAYVDIFSPQEEGRANDFYKRAEEAAPNDLARARFQLQGEEVRLRRGRPPVNLKVTRENAETLAGTAMGYQSAQIVVLMLMAQDQRQDAMTFLQTLVPTIPPVQQRWWDDFRLMMGLIDGRGRGFAGRRALMELLENGYNPVRQRQALQLLADAATADPARRQLRELLEKLSGPNSKHRILESVLLYRAQLALADKRQEEAAARTAELLEKFPASPLRVHAYGLLAQIAWEQLKFRTVADNARKARAELANATSPREQAARAELTLLEAEALFRAGQTQGDKSDFRSAADAYAAALRERPAEVQAGNLMFQRVVAEIRAGSPEAAAILDEFEKDSDFDVENRWQAEWALARAGKTADAFARVTALLASNPGAPGGALGVKPDLRARMAWLQVKLSLDAGQPLQTPPLVDALLGTLGNLDASLREGIASTALLQKAKAEFQLGREQPAVATLQRVRAEYPASEAACESYLTEADYYADLDRISDAQKTLIALAENPAYKDSAFVPHAYFQLALLSERLGQEKDLKDALRRIEDLIAAPGAAGQGELVFAARMKQGDLFRKRNEFAKAQEVYDLLTRVPTSNENSILARLELARTYSAQAANDPLQADKARILFAELCERVDASPDVRVEAGYLLGELLKSRNKLEDAARVWWNDVIMPFLPLKGRPPVEFGATRLWWLARALLQVGEIYEQLGRLDDAQRAYRFIVDLRLQGEAAARAKLEKLGPAPVRL